MYIYRVIQSLQDFEDMEEINFITGINQFETDNWCDLSEFEDYPQLCKFVENDAIEALKNNECDYIIFRINK